MRCFTASEVAALRDRINGNMPFPKDKWRRRCLKTRPVHDFEYRDRKDERRMLNALLATSAPWRDWQIASNIAHCRPSRRCGSWVCHICRYDHWRTVRGKVFAEGRRLFPFQISFLTIIPGGTGFCAAEVKALIRDTNERLGEVLRAWPGVRLIGRYEVDYWPPKAVPQPDKQKTLKVLGALIGGDDAVLVPHIHAVLFHPGIVRDFLRFRLVQAFPGFKQVKLSPLHRKGTVKNNLNNMVGYGLKFPLPKTANGKGRKSLLRDFHHLMDQLGGLHGPLHVRIGL